MSSSNPYQELVDALVRELTSDQLEELPEDLFQRVDEWIRSLRNSASGGEAKRVVEALAEVCQELMVTLEGIRRAKSGMAGKPGPQRGDSPTGTEGGSTVGGVSAQEAGPLRPPKLPRGKVLVTFKTPLREFVASDLRVYGPFREGDVCLLPVEDAAALEARGVVEVLIGNEGAQQD